MTQASSHSACACRTHTHYNIHTCAHAHMHTRTPWKGLDGLSRPSCVSSLAGCALNVAVCVSSVAVCALSVAQHVSSIALSLVRSVCGVLQRVRRELQCACRVRHSLVASVAFCRARHA